MLELAGEICDGVCLNYGVSVDYVRRAIALVEKGAHRAGRSISDIDLPELIVVSMCDDDPDSALHEGKKLAAYYFATEPHIMKASGVSEEVADRAKALMGWPATGGGLRAGQRGHSRRDRARHHGRRHCRRLPPQGPPVRRRGGDVPDHVPAAGQHRRGDRCLRRRVLARPPAGTPRAGVEGPPDADHQRHRRHLGPTERDPGRLRPAHRGRQDRRDRAQRGAGGAVMAAWRDSMLAASTSSLGTSAPTATSTVPSR